jgi:hypothetical protein
MSALHFGWRRNDGSTYKANHTNCQKASIVELTITPSTPVSSAERDLMPNRHLVESYLRRYVSILVGILSKPRIDGNT